VEPELAKFVIVGTRISLACLDTYNVHKHEKVDLSGSKLGVGCVSWTSIPGVGFNSYVGEL